MWLLTSSRFLVGDLDWFVNALVGQVKKERLGRGIVLRDHPHRPITEGGREYYSFVKQNE